ncbi:MAG: 2-oxo acid dehydrogenase subunit E2, partial [Proteobacteria bacterium]
MPIDVTMPQLGESVTEGTITKWHAKAGDSVQKDQPLVEVATDKTDTVLVAPVTGKLASISVQEGETVGVGTLLGQVEEGAAGEAAPKQEASSQAPAEEAPKAQDGGSSKSASGGALASPSVRQNAREEGVDLGGVQGTGDRGRVTHDDVSRAKGGAEPQQAPQQQAPQAQAPQQQQAPQASSRAREVQQLLSPAQFPVPNVGYGNFKVPAYRAKDGDQVVPFTRRRRITADHMVYSKVTAPHVVTVAEVDLHKTSKLREANKDRYKKEGLSLTMLAFVTAATARALREFPNLNSRVLDNSFVVLKDVNVGVAVNSPDGLVVPVVRRADELGVRGIVRAIDDLAKRAKTGKIVIDDLAGASFSVTNPGLKGNLFGGAIINQPNVGILRTGEIKKRVVVVTNKEGDDQMV